MVIRPSPNRRGWMVIECVVALGILIAVMIPVSFSFISERRACRNSYYRAVAVELVDGEMEILRAGEWRQFPPGQRPCAIRGAAVQNLPPGQFLLTIKEHSVRLQWQPAAKDQADPSPVKPSFPKNADGYLLIELLVFMALTMVILGLAFAAYWRCFDNAKHLQKNAGDILAAVQAGERWRDDVRLARDTAIDPQGVNLIQSGDTIEYRFREQAIWRRSTHTGQNILLLSKVKSSAMSPDERQQVRAWRWEVELQSGKAPPFLRPLFTFEAVPVP